MLCFALNENVYSAVVLRNKRNEVYESIPSDENPLSGIASVTELSTNLQWGSDDDHYSGSYTSVSPRYSTKAQSVPGLLGPAQDLGEPFCSQVA